MHKVTVVYTVTYTWRFNSPVGNYLIFIYFVLQMSYAQFHYKKNNYIVLTYLSIEFFIRYSLIYMDRVWFGFYIWFMCDRGTFVPWIPWFYVSNLLSNHRNMTPVRLICKRCYVHVVNVYIFLLIIMFSCF